MILKADSISPFTSIDKMMAGLEHFSLTHKALLKDVGYEETEKPKWFTALIDDGNIELAKKFKKHFGKDGSSTGLYAEIMCGASPSKGCESCGFYYQVYDQEKRCNFTGSCTPMNNKVNRDT